MRSRDELKHEALAIFQAGLDAVNPADALRRHLSRSQEGEVVLTWQDGRTERWPVGPDKVFRRVLVLGAGKAAARMARAVEEILGDLVVGGLVVTKYGHGLETTRVEVAEAAHPVPDRAGLDATARLVDLAKEAGEDTLVVMLISGGGSALLPLPALGITLEEKQRVTDLLLDAGADIGEMNAVRKHLSAIKGGWLARHAAPATVLSLILSDVVGDHLDVIASGPTVPDHSTFGEAREVLRRRELLDRVPVAVRQRIEQGVAGELDETPKGDDPLFGAGCQVLIGTNAAALKASCHEARARGWNVLLLSSEIEGETRDVARMHAAIAREVGRGGGDPVSPPACIVSGGETTVTIRGTGQGGRNQEFALAAALDIRGALATVVVSAGTDGTDGPTDATGALAFGDTVARGIEAGLDARHHLVGNDAYPFFDVLGDLIRTGPTGTNVMDIHLVLVDQE